MHMFMIFMKPARHWQAGPSDVSTHSELLILSHIPGLVMHCSTEKQRQRDREKVCVYV